MASHTAAARPTLPVELHAATRSEHTLLNRTIIARLPLCLPNATSTPTLYAQGITVFSRIYNGFEDAWDNLLKGNTLSQRERDILADLNIPRLRRKERLQTSLRTLQSKSAKSLGPHFARIEAETWHFEEDIKRAIQQKPHLLLAYTWTMYLALFNGGRWIAKQLLNAGSVFWNEDEREEILRSSLPFWFFGDDEDYDGEDIKVAFKEKFNYTTANLTDVERDEIIAESRKLFATCMTMIEYLDETTQKARLEPAVQLQEISPGKTSSDQSGVFDYLPSFTHLPITRIWRSVFGGSQASLPVSLRREIEQKDG